MRLNVPVSTPGPVKPWLASPRAVPAPAVVAHTAVGILPAACFGSMPPASPARHVRTVSEVVTSAAVAFDQ
jgi:hypothetical protein